MLVRLEMICIELKLDYLEYLLKYLQFGLEIPNYAMTNVTFKILFLPQKKLLNTMPISQLYYPQQNKVHML